MQITYTVSEEDYMDLLDDIYGTVEIAGMTYDTGRALRELDPIAFRCGLGTLSLTAWQMPRSTPDTTSQRNTTMSPAV